MVQNRQLCAFAVLALARPQLMKGRRNPVQVSQQCYGKPVLLAGLCGKNGICRNLRLYRGLLEDEEVFLSHEQAAVCKG